MKRVFKGGYGNSSNKAIIIIFLIFTALLITDRILSAYFPLPVSNLEILLFITLLSAYAVTQYLILSVIYRKSQEIGRAYVPLFGALRKLVLVAQYAIVGILVILALTLTVVPSADVTVLFAQGIFGIGGYIAAVILWLLAWQHFSWYALVRDSTNLSFGAAIALFAFDRVIQFADTGIRNVAAMAAFIPDIVVIAVVAATSSLPPTSVQGGGSQLEVLLQKDDTLQSYYQSLLLPPLGEASRDYLHYIDEVFRFAAYTLALTGLTLVLHDYLSQKLGRIKSKVVLSIPIGIVMWHKIVFLVLNTSVFFFDPIATESEAVASDQGSGGPFVDLVREYLASVTLQHTNIMDAASLGFLSGSSFFSIVRTMPRHSPVRSYLIISAFGIGMFILTLASSANGASMFGLLIGSSETLAAYLTNVGIYSSAIFISRDLKLFRTIRKTALQLVKSLGSIASAQMEQEIEQKVLSATRSIRDSMIRVNEDIYNDVAPPSPTDDDMKKYLLAVLEEIKKGKDK